MTEEEARKKWCPMLGHKERQYGTTIFPDSINCIASDCMAWKEKKKINDEDDMVLIEWYCGLIK